jgi:tetratricopeptide (TPR) repeat protein
MGLLGNLRDAVKQRLDDPPQYEPTSEKCSNCEGSGCAWCNNTGYKLKKVGGTGLFEAVSQTHKAAALTKEFTKASSVDDAMSNIAKVEAQADKALKLNPNHFDSLWLKGLVEVAKGNLKSAVGFLERALIRRKHHRDLAILLIDVYEKLGRTEDAERVASDTLSAIEKREARKDALKFGTVGLAAAIIADLTGIEIGDDSIG